MTITLYERYGTPHTVKEGTKTIMVPRVCGRCGGAGGADKWKPTGWTCYQCGGCGRGEPKEVRLYTQERIDALNAALEKRRAKKAAKAKAKADALEAERALIRDAFRLANPLLEVWSLDDDSDIIRDIGARCLERCTEPSEKQVELVTRILDRRIAEAKARNAGHLGKVGERIELTVTLNKKVPLHARFYGEHRILYIMTDAATGANVTWMNTGHTFFEEGATVRIKGTVKEHGDYNGKPQTKLTRVKLIEPATATAA
jgi:hypothetical protein